MGKIVRFKRRKKKKKFGRKIIPHWSGVYVARSDVDYHNCDVCNEPILKGYQYERNVYSISVSGRKCTLTERIHISPPCEMFLPPDDDYEIERSNKKSFENAA